MNASPASPACAATGTPPRDTGVRGTGRHVLHLRAGPVAPAVGRLVVGEGAGGQSSKVIVHRARWCQASRACVQGTPSQVKGRGRYRASNFWSPLQGGLKYPSHAAGSGKPRGGRRVARRATNQQRGVRESDARPILSGAGRRAGRSGGGSVRASAQGALRLGSPRREPQHEVL